LIEATNNWLSYMAAESCGVRSHGTKSARS